ncbi:putative acyl-CoA dehydrogenase [Meredithblackwellia eburnea MCA 4105]
MTGASGARKQFGELEAFSEPAWYRGLPSPYYNESHDKLRAAIRTWVEEHLFYIGYEWEERGTIDHKVYEQMAKDNIIAALACGAKVPQKWARPDGTVFGGVKWQEWDGFHDFILIDELNRSGSAGAMQGLAGGLQIATPTLFTFGSQELQNRVLPDIMSGKKRICLAITEPEAGSDVKNLSCEAKLSADGKHYIVNGTKKWITNGIYSDFFSAAVRTAGKAGDTSGISLLLIPNGPGVTRKRMLMSGGWCAGTTYLTFEEVLVPVENLIGKEGAGFKYIMTNFRHERMMIAYVGHRLARIALEDAMRYAHKRKVFGKRLIDSEVIRNKFAHCARLVESQQAWIESVIYSSEKLTHEEADIRLGGTTALLKANTSLVLETVARESVQILGGIGLTRGGQGERIERIKRDVTSISIPGGSEEILLDYGIRQELRQIDALRTKL